jgi:transcription termination factor NusB
MTIETATPSSVETIAALFDNLVDAVTARVMDQVAAKFTIHMDAWALNSMVFEDKVTEGVQAFVDNQLDLDDAVRQALDNIDLDDMVMTAVQELEFNVRVSR